MDDLEFQQLLAAFPDVAFTEAMQADFRQWWQIKTYPRKALISPSGQVEKFFYVVIEGAQVLYILDQKGNKVVLGFSFAGSMSGLYDSFLKQRTAISTLEALSDSRMWALPISHWETMLSRYPVFERHFRIFNQEVLFGRLQREVELSTLTAEERYIAFMRRIPPELHEIPLKYLASYLNMQPETFSRLRAKIDY